MTLTTKAIEAAKPKEKGYKLSDASGLYLFVGPTGLKSWRANYLRNGKQATRTYGRWPEMSLAAARKAHVLARDAVATAVQTRTTFAQVVQDWLKIKLPTLSNGKHQIQVAETLARHVLPSIGQMPIDQIKRADLVAVVQAAQAGGKIETAHRVAGRICMVFDYAQDAGILDSHPASGLTRVLQSRQTKKPMASIAPAEAGELFRAIESYPEIITRLGLQLLAHTFVRPGELRGMRWNELVADDAVWIVPAERMKLRKPHVVPLSRQALAILAKLRDMTGDGDLVLDSPQRPGHSLSENTFLFALYRLGYRGRMTAHGFRSLASTVLNESGFEPDVIERQLAHQESDAVRAAYNRAEYLPKRREMMQWWAGWIEARSAA